MYFYQARASYYFSARQPQRAHEANRAFLQLLENHPGYLTRFCEAYLGTLNHYLIDCLMLRQYKELDAGLKKLDQAAGNPVFGAIKHLSSRIFRQKMMLQLNRALLVFDSSKNEILLLELNVGLQQFEKEIEPHHKISLYYLAAYLLFKDRKYDEVY